jgi:hypothetical protein
MSNLSFKKLIHTIIQNYSTEFNLERSFLPFKKLNLTNNLNFSTEN